jgi:hypothetical protein
MCGNREELRRIRKIEAITWVEFHWMARWNASAISEKGSIGRPKVLQIHTDAAGIYPKLAVTLRYSCTGLWEYEVSERGIPSQHTGRVPKGDRGAFVLARQSLKNGSGDRHRGLMNGPRRNRGRSSWW